MKVGSNRSKSDKSSQPVARHNPAADAFAEEPLAAAGAVPRLYERAMDILSKEISRGRIGMAARLTETDVARRFGISRAPARRALASLAEAGLIKKSDGRGYVVAGMSGHGSGTSRADTEMEKLRLVSSSSWERIYSQVEEEIIGRISFSSWRVNEAEMARHFGVSRTVARDVVGRLQQRGLVLKDARSRWYAPALSPERVGELYELRAILEPVALGKASSNLPDGLIDGMRANLETAMAEPASITGSTLESLEQEMHVELLGFCANATLMQAITVPQSLLIAHRFLYRWTPRLFVSEPFLPEHLEILEQLAGGRVVAAAKALEKHLYDSRERALARVEMIRSEFVAEGLSYLEPVNELHDPGGSP